ncbi:MULTISPECIES: hypothetical protein [Gordonia]|uniref:hypothetical protein n=1 Tax=Gordonia TaxID=2053 RepID=UPI002043DC0C|nr:MULTISPECIES: hypothetical protein [Gordonia]MCM3893883.1 hypothetical protein [Gordonia sputi]
MTSGRIVAFPVSTPPTTRQPSLVDDTLDADAFQRGFDDATTYLATMPDTWARHHASSALASGDIPEITQSYERGYRAALYGFVRQARR